ncbi:MAG: D-3-phosphoglycerate dehydrogenase [Myxococcota bacterium]|jgi:D-3-phosphoglycerate dehydrogenase
MARIHLGPLQRVIVVENPSTVLDEQLTAAGVTVTRLLETPSTPELIALIQQTEAQAIFKRSRVPVTRALIEACPSLLAVQLCCIGDDSVDKQACADHGIMVFNDPISNGRSVVEMVIAHLLTLSRRLYETNDRTRLGEWEKNNHHRYEVKGKVLGVLGLGNIGRGVARVADALGMTVQFYDTRQVSLELGRELGWSAMSSVDELFATSDYITVHLSARDIHGTSNAALLSGENLMKLGVSRPENSPRIFLNLSRGFLHTAEALKAAVECGQIRRAAVDVYPEEPRSGSSWVNPYADVPQVVTTPHIGASTQEAQPRIAGRVSQTFGDFSTLGALRDCVFAPRIGLSLPNPRSGGVILAVVHSTARGTKRAIDNAIFDAGASNLASAHRDFEDLGVAYDLAMLDKGLSDVEISALIASAAAVTGDPGAIRSVRQIAT